MYEVNITISDDGAFRTGLIKETNGGLFIKTKTNFNFCPMSQKKITKPFAFTKPHDFRIIFTKEDS